MTNPILNNFLNENTAILWQYDKAYNLIRLLNAWAQFSKVSCTDFWNYFGNNIFTIDSADTFGLNVWGNMLGLPRPRVLLANATDSVAISDDLYRRLLKAHFFILTHKPTVPNYNKYLAILWGCFDNADNYQIKTDIFDWYGNPIKKGAAGDAVRYEPRARVLDNQDMTMGFTFPQEATDEEAYLIFQHFDLVYPFPAGIRYPGEFVYDDLVIGLNTNQEAGLYDQNQYYKNFVDGLVMAEETNPSVGNPDGGIFSETNRANYKVNPIVSGVAYVVNITDAAEPPHITLQLNLTNQSSKMQAVWIDWGNAECNYYYIPPATSLSLPVLVKRKGRKSKTTKREAENGHTASSIYSEDGLYSIIVMFKENAGISVSPDQTFSPKIIKSYPLSEGGIGNG